MTFFNYLLLFLYYFLPKNNLKIFVRLKNLKTKIFKIQFEIHILTCILAFLNYFFIKYLYFVIFENKSSKKQFEMSKFKKRVLKSNLNINNYACQYNYSPQE